MVIEHNEFNEKKKELKYSSYYQSQCEREKGKGKRLEKQKGIHHIDIKQ